ncbi:hypothetical protein, partial [Microbacterium sp.]|uniref:hypothetical protein n=1 Tax=Microbacterium sp. TaxID=51671 RepID=UPI0028AA1AEE
AGKIGRGTAQLVTRAPADRHEAVGLLADLVELRDLALVRPLPLPVELAFLYSSKLRNLGPRAAERLAANEWRRSPGRFGPPPERDAEEIVRVWGRDVAFGTLVDDGFTRWAPRLWDGALDHQQEAAL